MFLLHNTQLCRNIRTWASRKVTDTVKNLWTLVTQIFTVSLYVFLSLSIYISEFHTGNVFFDSRGTHTPVSSDFYFLFRQYRQGKKKASKDVSEGWYVWIVGVRTTGACQISIQPPALNMFWKLWTETSMLWNSLNSSNLAVYLKACFHLTQETVFFLNSKNVAGTHKPIQSQRGYRRQGNYKSTKTRWKSNQIKRRRMFQGEQKEVNEIPNLPGESRNVHGVGGEAHAKSHGWLNTQKPGNQLLHLLVDVQVPWKWHNLSLTSQQCTVTCRVFLKEKLYLFSLTG